MRGIKSVFVFSSAITQILLFCSFMKQVMDIAHVFPPLNGNVKPHYHYHLHGLLFIESDKTKGIYFIYSPFLIIFSLCLNSHSIPWLLISFSKLISI